MNKEEILNKYIDLIDKGYCSDCNELNCIDNLPHEKITHAIRELLQENKKYKEVIEKAIKLIEDTYYSKNTTNIDSIILSSDKLLRIREILKEVE